MTTASERVVNHLEEVPLDCDNMRPGPKLEIETRRKRMATTVNLDALISREDFDIENPGIADWNKGEVQVNDLERDSFFYGALRKPDFQRETIEWDSKRVFGLIKSFIEDELIPGVIIWKHQGLLFVIDGSHRLSALIAWVQDDYGDGERSRAVFGTGIPDEQLRIAGRTRKMIEEKFGSYKDHRDAIINPKKYGPDIIDRALRFGSLGITIQRVKGNAAKAEDSFIRINQQAVNITPQELELIKSRKKPNAIAARAIIRRGKGHKYWSAFEDKVQDEIQNIATDVHSLMFMPPLHYPIKSLDMPAGGSVYSAQALRMVYDFINLSVGAPSPEDDEDGRRTIEYLKRAKRVMQLLLSKDESSLGLHPSVYCYSWTGKQQPILFLVTTNLIINLDRKRKLPMFIECRERFEAFLMGNRSLINQIIRKFGTKTSGTTHLKTFYERILNVFNSDGSIDEALNALVNDKEYSYLQPGESPYESTTAKRLSTQVKSGHTMRELLATALRCPICHGLIPSQAISTDHVIRREDGGRHSADNLQSTHPYCNTGYNEAKHAREIKAAREN